ncbi:unnamed protein product [Prorocentrum cordatum]|uniref:Uncharacterized protein n=1 Tax=Prorocentrum cordatum TaxID=2364126 RepID=A0ABN9R3L2_9DINO|nr:unnamed protein product [Polarella glacialis]CAK0872845.1 unnamed protein product [Polarella glacialis]
MPSRFDLFGALTATPRPVAFKRHGSKSKSHQAAVQMLLSGKGVGKRKKVRAMAFCLAEAAIAGARGLTITQDSRKRKLLMRFTAASDDLVVRERVLGHIQLEQGAGADDLMKASMRIIANFCAPPRNGARAKVDQALLKAAQHKVEHYSADAAPDEQLAGNLLRGRPYRVSQSWFSSNVARLQGHFIANLRIQCVSMCACLSDSRSKPTGRGVLFYEPCLPTAMQIAQVRNGSSEGDIAADFLGYVDEEKLIQLGMLADAGGEASARARTCDSDDLDEAELPSHNAFFLQRIAMLFVESHCYDLGCTKFVHDAVVKRPVAIFARGHPRTIGGPGSSRSGSFAPEIKERCRTRMVAWCRLAQATFKAEWPHFEEMAASDAFNLQTVGRHALEAKTANEARCEMIANALGLDLPALLNGYLSVLPVALQKKKASPGLANVEAWRMAMSHSKAARKDRAGSFKQPQWAVEQRRSSCSDALENDEIQIACWEKCMGRSTIAEVAQGAWQLRKHGPPRTPGPWGRIDKGAPKKNIKRKVAALMGPEKAWVERRRQGVEDMMARAGGVARSRAVAKARRESARGGGWTDPHSRQETTLRHKRMEYFVDSIMDGATAVNDLSEEMCRVVLQEVERRRKASLSRSAKWRRNDDAFTGPKRSLEGLRLFVEKDVDVCEVDLVRSIRKDNMARTADRSQADIYVVGMLSAQQGAPIACECAAKKRRQVFATDSFIEAHPVVHGAIRTCYTMQGTTWTRLKSANDVRDKNPTPKQAGRGAELPALVSLREKRDLPEDLGI